MKKAFQRRKNGTKRTGATIRCCSGSMKGRVVLLFTDEKLSGGQLRIDLRRLRVQRWSVRLALRGAVETAN